MKTKIMIALLIIMSLRLFASEKLGMFVEVKRFLDEKKYTKFVIDYQVPYKNLMFEGKDKIWLADLKVKLSIANSDSVLYSKEFTNKIGVSNQYDVTSSSKSFLDRISLVLAKPGFKLNIRFEDTNGDKVYEWNYIAELLSADDKLSDVELLANVTADTTSYSQKFNRNGKIHVPSPSGLISKDIEDSLYLFCEAYNYEKTSKAVITILKDKQIILIQSYPLSSMEADKNLLFPVNLSAMDIGRYTGKIELVNGESTFSKAFEFILTEQSEKLSFIMTDSDEEYQLLKYLGNVKSQTSWKTLSKEAKRRYISQFWSMLATQNSQSVESVIKLYKERIDYCNSHFSHFEKGWTTDRGRIYIRNGMPADMVDDHTDDTRFVSKDYQVWKYSSNNHAAYIFVDIQMNGNYKLVYAKNDDRENTYPDWQKYVGSDFDETSLEKTTGKNLDDSSEENSFDN